MKRRRGSLFIEVAMAVVVMSIALVALAQMMIFASYQQQENRRRSLAVQVLGNAMERVAGHPWENINQATADALTLTDVEQTALPAAEFSVFVEETEPQVKVVTVELSWMNRLANGIDPLRLKAWQYRGAEPEVAQ